MDGLSLLTTSRVSVYYSHEDDVLKLSQTVNGLQRLGQDGPKGRNDGSAFPPVTFQMYDATDIKDFDRNFLTSHQYYRLSPTVREAIAADMAPM
jgi:esterase/lipase superfamily enzyme